MSPSEASSHDDVLKHPRDAFEVYRRKGVLEVICEEKHMGPRAVVLVAGNLAGFGAPDGWRGTVYTRTGRPFFVQDVADEFLDRLDAAVDRAGIWQELDADWLLLDAELLAWSLKVGDMLRGHYAAVGAAATSALGSSMELFNQTSLNGVDVHELLLRTVARDANAQAYVAAYRNYSGASDGFEGVQLTPSQLLASEGRTYSDRDQGRHLGLAGRLVEADPELIRPTLWLRVDVSQEASVDAGTQWWEGITATGGEGMVVKLFADLVRGTKGLLQPGIKVRGREYLRIICGPDYTEPGNLARLRNRNVAHKRSMALREYARGIESLERLVAGDPLWRVHQAVFTVLAMDSEPADPRL